MNDFKTSRNDVLVDTKPMFASTWIVLFNELRKNYNDRHLVDSENKEPIQSTKQNQPDLK
ncbi:MAG: hypothetical protein OES90_11580 [Xanthomonadales bacterium]|jgi:hypothetical protein|nr:hypothetical protein [Xanthomonadales bacterium]